jgi:hypothetical protein
MGANTAEQLPSAGQGAFAQSSSRSPLPGISDPQSECLARHSGPIPGTFMARRLQVPTTQIVWIS